MKIFNKLILFIIVFFGAFYFANYLQSINSKTVEPLSTKMDFLKKEHDFKNIIRNKEVTTFFIYENKGNNPLKINNISSTCGCTIPVWSRKLLDPGQKDSILVKYDSKTLGYFSKSIYVVSNSVNSPDVIHIKGEVFE